MDAAADRDTSGKSLFLGVVAGLAGGLVASLVMNQFQEAWSKIAKALEEVSRQSKVSSEQETFEWRDDYVVARENEQDENASAEESDNATEKVARHVAAFAMGRALSKEEKKIGGSIVHYTFGSIMGGLYGAVAEHYGRAHLGHGLIFGTVLFLGADEVGVPLFKLSGPPSETPLSKHAEAWAAHVVYGATTEIVRGLVRRIL